MTKDKEPVVSTGAELLADIQQIFENKQINRIRTAELLQALCDDAEAGWQTYNHGRPITPRQIAKRLDEYCIKPKSIRFGYGDTPKGYELDQFQDAFARYLRTPPENGTLSATPPQLSSHNALSVADNPPQNSSATRSATLKPAPDNDCCGIADKTPLEPNAGNEPERKFVRL